MSTVTIDEAKIERAIEDALFDTVEMAKEKIKEITPRDAKRPPKDISQHVTWALRNSIDSEKKWKFEYIIWTQQGMISWESGSGVPDNYAWVQEFWSEYTPARSFLRKWITDNAKKMTDNFAKRFQEFVK